MLISVAKTTKLMMSALHRRGFSDDDARCIVQDYLGAELEGRRTHGLGRFIVIDRYLSQGAGDPEVVRDVGAVAVIDGNRGVGQLVCRDAAALAVVKAKRFGVGVVAARNFTRFSRLVVHAESIAHHGMIAAALSCGGAPPLMPPPNSGRLVLGTNPLAFAFPREGGICSFDFATSQRAWGHVRQAVIDGTDLPAGFIDIDGRPVLDPARAVGVLPEAGGKGFALAFAIEVLSGALAGAPLGAEQSSQLELGFLVIALDPVAFGVDVKKLMMTVRRLSDHISTAPMTVVDGPAPHAPGDKAKAVATATAASGRLDLPSTVVGKLKRMAAGRPVVDDLPSRQVT